MDLHHGLEGVVTSGWTTLADGPLAGDMSWAWDVDFASLGARENMNLLVDLALDGVKV